MFSLLDLETLFQYFICCQFPATADMAARIFYDYSILTVDD